MPLPVSRPFHACGLCAFALLATAALAQPDSGSMLKMSVTMKMQVPGAGDLPVRTTTLDVCISSSHDMRVILQRQRGCVVSDYRQVGHVVSYHLVCGGDPPRMTGDASFELLPDGGTNGSVHANGYIGGQGVVMDMTYAGQRTDSCDYAASRQRH